ncbi:MAG: inorganic diphosphatase, partial [Clostridiaceae bacterium]|nr:inorganic diphosphatase [Clostridiaceae bacterium]
TATHYPADYGFIPRTIANDDDPLDVLVICSEPILPLTLVRCYPIGQVAMLDEGKEDIKIIAIPFKDPTWNCFRDIMDLPTHILDEIKHFFNVYKQLEGKKMEVLEISTKDVAEQTIKESISMYEKTFPWVYKKDE